MNKQPDNPAQGNGNGEMNNKTRKIQPETLIELARDYFAADFPNSDRQGCPDGAMLNSLAQSGRLPDDELRAHLFGCSACFTEYRTALAERPQPLPVIAHEAPWWDRLRAAFTPFTGAFRPGFAWAGAAALVLIAFGVWTARRVRVEAPPQIIAQRNAQAPAPSIAPAPEAPAPAPRLARTAEQPALQPRPAAKRRRVAPAAEAIVSLDLNEYVAMRDVSDASRFGQQVITLAPVRTRLKLRLPEGSLAGRYTVSLVDEFEHSLITDKPVSRMGKTLIADMDLRNFSVKSYRLKIQSRESTPDFYAVTISERKPIQK
ncbi:MAG: hypothetical protein ABI977_24165 [Acidobacteriota bacterium]